jgi:hypothetical protein
LSKVIGTPHSFSHVEHVEYNPATKVFTGIPEDWGLGLPSEEWGVSCISLWTASCMSLKVTQEVTMQALKELIDHHTTSDNVQDTPATQPKSSIDLNKNETPRIDINAWDVFSAFPDLDLSGRVIRHGKYPIATNGAFADIWQGVFDDRLIAIKVLRVALVSDEKTKKVSLIIPGEV